MVNLLYSRAHLQEIGAKACREGQQAVGLALSPEQRKGSSAEYDEVQSGKSLTVGSTALLFLGSECEKANEAHLAKPNQTFRHMQYGDLLQRESKTQGQGDQDTQ